MSNFADVLHKMAKGTSFVLLPRFSPQLLAYSDVSKRVSMCKLCGLAIPKNSKRSVLAFRTRMRRVFRSGGSTSVEMVFLHPACIVPILDGKKKGFVDHHKIACWDCGKGVPRALGVRAAGPSGRDIKLCLKCSKLPEYQACARCTVLVSKRHSSVVVGPHEFLGDEYLGLSVCDGCAVNAGFMTAKIKAKEERREKRFQDQYDRLAEKLRLGKGFE